MKGRMQSLAEKPSAFPKRPKHRKRPAPTHASSLPLLLPQQIIKQRQYHQRQQHSGQVVEVVAETSAPLRDYADLLETHPRRLHRRGARGDGRRRGGAPGRLEQAREAVAAAEARLAGVKASLAEAAAGAKAAAGAERAVRAEQSAGLRRAQAAEAEVRRPGREGLLGREGRKCCLDSAVGIGRQRMRCAISSGQTVGKEKPPAAWTCCLDFRPLDLPAVPPAPFHPCSRSSSHSPCSWPSCGRMPRRRAAWPPPPRLSWTRRSARPGSRGC